MGSNQSMLPARAGWEITKGFVRCGYPVHPDETVCADQKKFAQSGACDGMQKADALELPCRIAKAVR